MSTVLIVLAVWFLASIPFGILMGRMIAAGQSGDLSRYLLTPKDDER